MVGCSAVGCKNRSERGFTMVRFPRTAPLRQKWLEAMGRDDVSSQARLCEAHFAEDQWERSKSRLKPESVPKIFPCCKTRRSLQTLPDHSYCSSHSPDCPKRETCLSKPDLPPVLQENCALEEQVGLLQSLLEKAEKEKLETKQRMEEKILATESSLLHASDLMRKEATSEPFTLRDVKQGLRLKMSCGRSGYQTLQKELPDLKLPSIRTLQRKTEHIKFLPGLQEDIFEALKVKVALLDDVRDRDCVAFLDEMSSKSQLDFDLGTREFIGHVTLPGGQDELSSKTEAYMFGGMKARWKQTVGYHFTSSKGYAKEKKEVVFEMIRKGHEAGLNVVALACDMGNRSMLYEMGFGTQKDNIRFSIPHPADSSKKLYVVPDCVHVFKSLKEGLCTNKTIILSDEVVNEFKLPSNKVLLSHIQWLEEYQRGQDLKFVPKLTFKDIQTNHFSKMNFKSAHTLLSYQTASSLQYLADKNIAPEEFETTAWFIKIMNRWREIVTSRCRLHSLNIKRAEDYDKKIRHLQLVVKVFKSMKFEAGWKPVQTHLILATEALIAVQHDLLTERNYEFVLLARFSQDIIENLFSVVRLKRPHPSPTEVKYRLKEITLSQFMPKVTKSQYDYADMDDFIDLLLAKEGKENSNQSPELDHTIFVWSNQVPSGHFRADQEDILYKMSGYCVVSLMKENKLSCENCVSQVRHQGLVNHPNSHLLKICNFKEGALFEVSDTLFQMFCLIEYNLSQWKKNLKSGLSFDILIEQKIIPSLSNFHFNHCHDLKKLLITKFTIMRLKQFTTLFKECKPPSALTSQLSSRSSGSQYLADRFSGSGKAAKERYLRY